MTRIDRRKFLAGTLSSLTLALSGCAGYTDGMTIDEILALLKANSGEGSDSDEEVSGSLKLAITFPAGRSPKVFTSGWVFGARCFDGDNDISDTVKWSGSGAFEPNIGSRSRPVFGGEGPNTITLSVNAGGKSVQKTFKVVAVSPGLFATVGSLVHSPADAHGCPACPHPTVGQITTGSPNVFVNGKPAARVGDIGRHAACCGPNTFEITGGDPEVLINGRAAARMGSATRHCGGSGTIKYV